MSNGNETFAIQTELRNFVQFATQRVETGELCSSLEELVQQWRRDTEYVETVADVRQGIADDADGKTQPVADAIAEVRQKLGITS